MRAFRSPALLAAAAIFLASPAAQMQALAQSKDSGLALSNDKPIQIESDNLEIREQEKKAYFNGNVRVAQGEMTLQAAKMTVFYKSGTKSIASARLMPARRRLFMWSICRIAFFFTTPKSTSNPRAE